MYAIYGSIYHQSTPNVSIYIYIYTIHGSYGLVLKHIEPHSFRDPLRPQLQPPIKISQDIRPTQPTDSKTHLQASFQISLACPAAKSKNQPHFNMVFGRPKIVDDL